MKASLDWLEDRLEIPSMDKNSLARALTLTGTNVEDFSSVSDKNSDLLIGRILSVKDHPEADRLLVCQVDIGERTVQIVTGAPNTKEDALVVVAQEGARLAGGLEIKNSVLRGVESQGMMCSLDELGYTASVLPKGASEGIIILDEGVVGESFFRYFGLDRGTLDMEITYNRPDCLSLMGIAQEVATTFDLPLKEELSRDFSKLEKGTIPIERREGCFAYYGLELEDVTIKESPFKWQLRLMEMGVRPINKVVDATNLAMLYSGSPTHAFDRRQVEGGIIVDSAKENLVFETLDGVERKLEPGDLLIRDHKKIIGLAGIMGGENSQILHDSKNLIVEFANFDKRSIARTARRLNLRTEASSRFEKELEPERALLALAFFLDYMEGDYKKARLSGSHDRTVREPLYLRKSRAEALLGVHLSQDELKEIFRRLNLEISQDSGGVTVYPPVYRSDLILEADLIEEVARVYGFENIPSKLPFIPQPADLSSRQKFEWKLRDDLWALGFEEMLNYSFVSPRSAASIGRDTENPLVLINPLGEEFSQMRHSLLVSALDVIQRNENMRNERVKFFEIGNVFEQKDKILQSQMLSLASYGHGDFFSLKGALEELFKALKLEVNYVRSKEAVYHPGRSADIYHDDIYLGSFGELSPFVAKDRDIKKLVYLGELSMDRLFELHSARILHEAPSRYPAVTRDLAILVDKKETHKVIYDRITSRGGQLLREVQLFDLYEGEELGADKKSMAFHLVFQSSDRTLKDEEVEEAMENVLRALEELGAVRR